MTAMSENTPNAVVRVGNVEFGNRLKLALISGPCQLESRQHAYDMAGALKEIAERAGVDESEVLLDIPNRALLLSEPRIGKTDIPILDGDRVRPLSRYSPLAKAIQSRGVHDWAVMVSTPPRNREEVERAALRTLFD